MGAGWIIAWRLATRNIGLVSTLILVRLLQPSDFGLVTIASGFIASVDALSAIGVQDALIRSPDLDRDMYDTGFTLSLLRGIMTAILIAAIAWPVGAFFNDPRLGVVILALSAGALISAFENIGIIDFRREFAFRKEFDIQMWSRVTGVLTTITVAMVCRTYWALVAGILVARAMRLVQSFLMSSYRPRLTLRAWRRLMGFSLWTWALALLGQARERSDGIAIGRIMGAAHVGAFSVGLDLAMLPITEVVEPLNRALFSGFATLHNSAVGLGNMFLGAVGLGLIFVIPAGIGISMVADPMVRLILGAQWVATVPVVQILSIAATSIMLTQSCGTLLNATGRPHLTFYLSTISAVARIVSLIVLVPRLGLSGAALALAITTVVDLFLFVGATLPRLQVTLRQVLAIAVRPVIASAAMVAGLWWLRMAWTPSTASTTGQLCADTLLRCGVGALIYGAALLAAWLITGRPVGAERFVLGILEKAWMRIGRSQLAGAR